MSARDPLGEDIILVRQIYNSCRKHLQESGLHTDDDLSLAARRVVWARYYSGDDAWDKLKLAIGDLEEIVDRPEKEPF
jgi:hypothetical protein